MSMNDQNRQAWDRSVGASSSIGRQQHSNLYASNLRRSGQPSDGVFTHSYDTSIGRNNAPHPAAPSTIGLGDDANETKSLQSQVGALIPTANSDVLREVLKLLIESRSSAALPGMESSRTLRHPSINAAANFTPSIQHSSNPSSRLANSSWIADQDSLADAQYEWMSSVQPDANVPTSFNGVSHSSGQLNADFEPYENMSWESSVVDHGPHCTNFSVDSGAHSYRDSIANARTSHQPSDSKHVSVSSAVAVVPYLIHPERLDINRDSIQSSSSYDSTNTGWSASSIRSSTTSIGSQSSRVLRAPSLLSTMSSGPRRAGGGHRRSSSNTSNGQSTIPCTEAGCTTTFGRESDRDRHMETKHGDVLYECLLNTCTSQCPHHCQIPHHSCGFPRSRRDKIRKHLEDVHGWKITQKELPQSWLWSYVRERAGWTCRSCGVFLGNWVENSATIAGHEKICTDGLPNLVKRLSMEQPIEDVQSSSNSGHGTVGVGEVNAVADDEDEDDSNSLF